MHNCTASKEEGRVQKIDPITQVFRCNHGKNMQLKREIDAPINELKILFKNVWTSQKNLIIHQYK
jgi:hypothetical protein